MVKNFILDIDGVMTTDQFLYSPEGKAHRGFDPHDADGLNILKNKLNILFITADKRGFPIFEKRIKDMGYNVELVSGQDRHSYLKDGNFTFDMSGPNIYYNFGVASSLVEAKEEYELFILKEGYDLSKIKILTSLLFLNMASLHKNPFNLMLYFFGKMKLYCALREAKKIK